MEQFNTSPFKGKTILITGCSRGLGLEFVKQFILHGSKVIATCRNPDSAADLTSLISQSPESKVFQCDIDSTESIDSFVSQLNEKVDYLINNAGIAAAGTPGDVQNSILNC